MYVSNTQINTLVPYSLAGQTSVNVVVARTYNSMPASPSFPVPLTDTAPGIFTSGQTGSGQGAILNADCADPYIVSVNSASNPATAGCAITLFATGAGLWSQAFPDGSVYYGSQDNSLIATRAPLSLTIGGKPADILYAGPAPQRVWGTLQVNAIVPASVGSGTQPIVLTIGQYNNSQQQVTVAVR